VVRNLAAERLQALVSGRTIPGHYTVSGSYLDWRTEASGRYLLGVGSGLVWTVSDAALERSQALLFAGGTDFLDKRTRPSRDDVSVLARPSCGGRPPGHPRGRPRRGRARAWPLAVADAAALPGLGLRAGGPAAGGVGQSLDGAAGPVASRP
jgi:hypothetical protein